MPLTQLEKIRTKGVPAEKHEIWEAAKLKAALAGFATI